ncbi:MAG: peptidoglycan editing factor PgeF [Lautropia sp.]|nr:peptidoglycan editing factor PgeF [Lautropia sp.]
MNPVQTSPRHHSSRLTPDDLWPMPASPSPRIRWAFTQRAGGVSHGHCSALPLINGKEEPTCPGSVPSHGQRPLQDVRTPIGGGLNLGLNCGDDPRHVAINRERVATFIGQPVSWLTQVHGNEVLISQSGQDGACADAQIATVRGLALAVLVADCLPVLLADRQGRVIGAAHAGWRGLAGGVLENTVGRMSEQAAPADLVAWLGPCIGPAAFEVGEEVREAFLQQDAGAAVAFQPRQTPGKWLADLPRLARQRLASAGVGQILDSRACTWSDPARFWSYRRNPRCGRMAGLIWFA